MGSWDKETGVVDSSAGTIVWVRRRNGSWWPGKILRPEELSDAHLMSPRSGTPVKLLGREDASVDWYNLDKSKRVKAFRCGEFDDCIVRAESSLGMPPKKREKYARREDAILHALELEKKLLEEKYGKLGRSCNGKSSDQVEKTSVAPSECLGNETGKHAHPKSRSKEPDSAIEDKSMDHPLHEEKVKEGNLLLGDEDNSEIVTRMRGLQDIGLKTSHAKQELSSVTLNGFLKPEFNSNAHSLPGGFPATENEVHTNSKISLDRRKRSHEIWTDESLVRRRDKRRPLVQVLQNSAKVPVHHSLQHDSDNVSVLMSGEEQTAVIRHAKRSRRVDLPGESSEWSDDKQFCPNRVVIPPPQFEENKCPHPAALSEESASESSENTETDSSEADSLDSDADEEILALSDAALVSKLEPRCPSGTQVQHGSMSNEEPDQLVLANEVSHLPPCDPFSTCLGVSKWQLKGKRNNRGVAKRSTDLTDRRVFRGSMYGANLEGRESNACGEPDLMENDFRTRIGAIDNREYLTSKFITKGLDDFTHNIIDWEDLPWNDQHVPRGYWEEDSSNYFDPVFEGPHCFGGRMKSMLVDVELKVQSSYQREHVPMISLMSKLKGQAIVGHPIQIEALENGSSEILLSAADGIFPETSDNDTALPPVWRTARRTAKFRLPRPHPSATLDGGETMEHFHYADEEKKVLSKKSNVWRYDHKVTHPPLNRKFSRKPPKKISLSSSQKIKTLSSIGTERKLSNDFRHGTGNSPVNGLIEGESGPTAVACIPVKLVYSRLYEELVGRRP